MTINFHVPGSKRKELVNAVSEWLGEDVHYCGAPTFAYESERFSIDRNGSLTFDNLVDSAVIERLLGHLYDEGFEYDLPDAPESGDDYDLTINLPRSFFTDEALENVRKIVKGKESLLKKALGVDAVPVIVTEETVEFPWFNGIATTEEHDAYLHLILAIVKMAKEQKRVSARNKEVENEKYAFRCFLLRLGFIGDDFKWQRKFLLRNLSGSSAFKSASGKESEVNE